METDFDLDKGQKEKEHVHCTAKGRPQLKKSAVQMEIRRKRGGGEFENPFQMECGSSSVNTNHY